MLSEVDSVRDQRSPGIVSLASRSILIHLLLTAGKVKYKKNRALTDFGPFRSSLYSISKSPCLSITPSKSGSDLLDPPRGSSTIHIVSPSISSLFSTVSTNVSPLCNPP